MYWRILIHFVFIYIFVNLLFYKHNNALIIFLSFIVVVGICCERDTVPFKSVLNEYLLAHFFRGLLPTIYAGHSWFWYSSPPLIPPVFTPNFFVYIYSSMRESERKRWRRDGCNEVVGKIPNATTKHPVTYFLLVPFICTNFFIPLIKNIQFTP